MAVANGKSTVVTAMDADPRTLVDSILNRGEVFVSSGIATIAAADDDTSVYRVVRLPADVRILSIRIRHAAITAGTDYDIGAYRTLADGGAVVDKDSLADGLDLSSARGVATEVLLSNLASVSSEQRLWDMQSGITADPHTEYDIALTANTVGSAAGTVYVDVYWTY